MVLILTKMKANQKGVVHSIAGGRGLLSRLHALGIGPGTNLKKINHQPMQGPVVVEAAGCRLALGFGMAEKIMVEVLE